MVSCRVAVSRGGSWVGLALGLIALCGCGGGPKTYPIKGKLVFDQGDVKLLAGSTVTCANEKDPGIQAQGGIKEDGSFELQTYSGGKILPGAVEGTYKVWILLSSDDGGEEAVFKKSRIHPRYLDAKSSGLTFKVPAEGEVVLRITQGKPGMKMPSEPDPTTICRSDWLGSIPGVPAVRRAALPVHPRERLAHRPGAVLRGAALLIDPRQPNAPG